jgi:hypothetical protein
MVSASALTAVAAFAAAGTISIDRTVVTGSVGNPANRTATLTLSEAGVDPAQLDVSVATSRPTVLPAANVTVQGSGAQRVVSFNPVGQGTSTVTFTMTDPSGGTATTTITYAASLPMPDASGRYFENISDASSALDVGDGYQLMLNDETNVVFLFRSGVTGPPVRIWSFTAAQFGTSSEIDFEGMARSGDTLIITGSQGNNKDGEVRTERRTLIGLTITGSGADTQLAFAGRYNGLWNDLRGWDAGNGHGLGANALGFVAGTAPGVLPNPPNGLNVEGLEYAPDGRTLYLAFRAPTVNIGGSYKALIVPVTNPDALIAGAPATGPAAFGAPILLDLDGRSIREIRRNDSNEYLISAGPSPQNNGWALYTWDGDPAHQPRFNRSLPPENNSTGGAWESIVAVPHPLATGTLVSLVTDSGDTNFYGTGATKDLPSAYQKSYSADFALGPVAGSDADQETLAVRVPSPTGEFSWSISGDNRDVRLTDAENRGAYLESTGSIVPIQVSDTRTNSPGWSISGQVSDFNDGLPGRCLGWTPTVVSPGAGAVAGAPVASGFTSGNGLADASVLASAAAPYPAGSATVGADLDLRLPADTPAGSYSAVLTITALS